MKVVEYWHGTIKNYRYDEDVSVGCCSPAVGAGSLLLPVLPGAGSTTGVAAGGSLIFLALGSADSIFLEGIASRSRV